MARSPWRPTVAIPPLYEVCTRTDLYDTLLTWSASATPDLRLDEKTAPTASPSDNDSNTSFTVQVGIPFGSPACLQLICENQMVHYLARNAIPRLRRFLVDADKILAVSQNVVYYIINPAMKGKTK